MSKKITIELTDEIYDRLFDMYIKATEKLPKENAITFEQYLSKIFNNPIDGFFNAASKDGAADSILSSLQDALKNLDISQLDEFISSMKGMGSIFGDFTPSKKPDDAEKAKKQQSDIDAIKKKN